MVLPWKTRKIFICPFKSIVYNGFRKFLNFCIHFPLTNMGYPQGAAGLLD